jgi:transcriptional regulator with XRE-family HTH domain
MRPETIRDRVQAIRLPLKDLARASGLNEMTAIRTLRATTSPLQTTADALSDALIAEELRLRDYLNALHPPEKEVT